MEDLIDFVEEPGQLQIEAAEQLLAIENDPNAPSFVSSKIPKKKKKQSKPIDDGDDLINFEENAIQNQNLIDIGDEEGSEQLDYDSSEDAKEDEFGPIEPGCKRIIIEHDDLKFPVSWWDDTSIAEVREMVICACDSIIDSGFELLSPEDGQPLNLKKDIGKIKGRGEVYTIIKGDEKDEYEKLLGDRWRRNVLEVEPLRHIEAQKAVEFMQMGSNLLRYTGKSLPHMRFHQLSSDLKRLIWFSSSKSVNESKVDLRNVTNIVIGQKTEMFQSYPLPNFEHLSFSLFYKVGKDKEKYLALICKDELEFDLWVTGLRALSYHFKNYRINKMILLGHSKIYNKE